MEEETSVSVEATTEESQPETSTEETTHVEASEEDTASEETIETPAETQEVETEKPRKTSRASERIRELIAQKKALEAQLQIRTEPQLEGVDDTGIDPTKFAQSLEKRANQTASNAAQSTVEYYIAEKEFPLVKENTFVRSRAGELVDQNYTPLQAAEMASLEWQEITGQFAQKEVQRQKASQTLRQTSQIPQAGKKVESSSMISRAEIARMTPGEYVKNQSAIQTQLEKYGPESFE